LKLLFLNAAAEMGGAERALLDLLSTVRVARPSWEITLLLGQDGPLVTQAQDAVDKVVVLPLPAKLARLGDASLSERRLGSFDGIRLIRRLMSDGVASASYVRHLGRIVARVNPDVMHAHGFKMQLLGALTRPRHTALVWHLHDYIGSRPLTSRLLRAARRRCTVIVANSESVAADAARELGAAADIRTIHNVVDLARFHPNGPRLDLDALAGMPAAEPGTVRVGLVATFARWKGHETFLDALAKLGSRVKVRGYIIGGPLYQTDGSQHTLAELQAAARRLGLESTVGFTGFVADSAAAMRALDVVVHASTAPEPFGLAIAEAMATARPVIVSFAGGVRELVTPDVDALIHQPGDAEGLAKAIAKVAADPALRSRLGIAARQSALQRFDPARARDELLQVYAAFDRWAAA
jgi:glycosyltransferase involved in cell wall biosynthesis